MLPGSDDSLGHGKRLQPTVGLWAAPSPRRPPDAHSDPTPGSSRSRAALVRQQRGFGRRSQCSPWSRHATTPSANWVARSSASPSARRSCHEGAVVVAPERHDGGPCASALQDFAPGPGTMVAHGRSIAVAKSWIAAASRLGRSVVSWERRVAAWAPKSCHRRRRWRSIEAPQKSVELAPWLHWCEPCGRRRWPAARAAGRCAWRCGGAGYARTHLEVR